MTKIFRNYAKKPGFWEKSWLEKLEIEQETRFLRKIVAVAAEIDAETGFLRSSDILNRSNR
ncbi:MAG TPA: hypothetical protein DCY88_07065 [Cyanobacteria bacterium UBA11372]|nr:hypothetical protein [Cyanobacteria bacterium UBA11372]